MRTRCRVGALLAAAVLASAAGCRAKVPDLDGFQFSCESAACPDAAVPDGDPGDGPVDGPVDAPTDAPPADAPPDPDLLAHLTLDTISGNQTPDIVGNHTGSCLAGRCPLAAAGKINGALAFDGVDDGITLASGATLNPTTGSLSIWVYVIGYPTSGNFATIAGKPLGSAADNSYEIYIDSTGKVLVFATPAQITSSATLPLAQWVHVAATWTPTTLTLYVAGTQVGSTAATLMFDGNPVMLGMDSNGGTASDFLRARLDDARIYKRALSAGEIAALAM